MNPRPTSSTDAAASGDDGIVARYTRTRDPRLLDRIVASHQPLARFLAMKFSNRGEPVEDLIQVANVALVKAVERYEPGRGVKFTTYATPTIIGEIQRYFRDKAWSVKVPRRLQELNAAAAKARQVLHHRHGRAATVQEVAAEINATEEETLEAIELSHAYSAVSLDQKVSGENDLSIAEFVGEEDGALLSIVDNAELEQALSTLDQRERAVIVHYFFHDMSQAEIAAKLHISQMHVSRLQKRTLLQLKAHIDATRAADQSRTGETAE